jgi:hypothetical protein
MISYHIIMLRMIFTEGERSNDEHAVPVFGKMAKARA